MNRLRRRLRSNGEKASGFHPSALLGEAVEFLNVRQGGIYLDATLGGGGHTEGIILKGGTVLGIDRDPQALSAARRRIGEDRHFKAVLGNFRDLRTIASESGFSVFDGILFDLGLSLFQLRNGGRGFSYLTEDDLDMRSDPRIALTAKQVVNDFSRDSLYEIFVKFGEERLSSRLADFIENRRRVTPVNTTGDLFRIIREVAGSDREAFPTASRVFQALRIFVNDELENLKESLPRAFEILSAKGRLVAISYHSLEDRIVKNLFKEEQSRGRGRILTNRPLPPSICEKQENRWSRSAKLRALEKIHG